MFSWPPSLHGQGHEIKAWNRINRHHRPHPPRDRGAHIGRLPGPAVRVAGRARTGRHACRVRRLAAPPGSVEPRPARGTAAGVVGSIVLGTALLGFWPTRPAALLFGGVSLLVAGIRGYAGCEITAIGNWLLHRDDQGGCVVLSPVDLAERHLQERSPDYGGLTR